MKKPFVFFLFLLALSSCIQPKKAFEKYTPAPAPDYALEKNWAALPWVKDSADFLVPHAGLTDGQANAAVDVFFIHPTLYFGRKSWNAGMADKRTNQRVDKTTIRKQASVFNGSCKVYAPRYRQATLYSFIDTKGNGRKALELAYTDVKKAFEYYLKHYNKGRPIIIASHSQGTDHARKLIADFFEKDPALYKQLVAAYLVGGSIQQKQFEVVVPCNEPGQTGCLVAWHTMRWGTREKAPREDKKIAPVYDTYGNTEYVNPLTWKRDTTYAPATLNKGSLPNNLRELHAGIADAKVSGDYYVWVHAPKKSGYPATRNYHIADYSLFYMNIRENVRERIAAYLKK